MTDLFEAESKDYLEGFKKGVESKQISRGDALLINDIKSLLDEVAIQTSIFDGYLDGLKENTIEFLNKLGVNNENI